MIYLTGLQNVQQQWVPKPEPITGVPPGLEYLTQVDQLLIKQQIELLEGLFALSIFWHLIPSRHLLIHVHLCLVTLHTIICYTFTSVFGHFNLTNHHLLICIHLPGILVHFIPSNHHLLTCTSVLGLNPYNPLIAYMYIYIGAHTVVSLIFVGIHFNFLNIK